MNEALNILISVDERHVQNMLQGIKTVELRRRSIPTPSGSWVWIYSKVPIGEVCAFGIVDKVIEAPPSEIWDTYGKVSGITAAEFNRYFQSKETGCAIVFSSIQRLQQNISLDLLRSKLTAFHPPQFFKHLAADSKELALFKKQVSFT